MQSGEITLQRLDATAPLGWLERYSLVEKIPVALLFGAILGLSAPGFDQGWIAWIGLAPLLVLVRASRNGFEASAIGFVFGLGYYLVALSWFMGLFPLRWMGLDDWVAVQAVGVVWLLESMHQAALFGAFAWLVNSLPMRAGFLPHIRRPFFPYLIAVPLMWVFFQWVIATSEFFLALPVNQLAYTQHNLIEFIQMARIGGCGLVDFFLILANCVAASLVLEGLPVAQKLTPRSDQIAPKMGSWVDIVLVSSLVAGFMAWGSFNVRQIAGQSRAGNEDQYRALSPAVPIAVLQGNVTIEEERLKTIDAAEIAHRYANLGTGTGAVLILVPEATADPRQFSPGMLMSKLKGIVNSERKDAVVGTVEKVRDGLISAARLIASPVPLENIYVKQRLIPFGEAAPFGALGVISSRITNTVAGGDQERLVNVQSAGLLRSAFGKIGVSIATEVIFPNLVAQEVRRGAQLLVNLANLNRFHNSALNQQVVAAATLRAVENGRFMIVSTNTGISAVIDPAGVVTTMSFAGKRGVLLDTVQFLYKKTPFNKMSRMWWL